MGNRGRSGVERDQASEGGRMGGMKRDREGGSGEK